MMDAPAGASHAALQTLPVQGAVHMPLYAVTPVMEILHKTISVFIALMLVFGTYAAVDPQYARFASTTVGAQTLSFTDAVKELTRGGPFAMLSRASAQLGDAASNPGTMVASAQGALFGGVPNFFNSLARSVNNSVNGFVYSIAFPNSLVQSIEILVFLPSSSCFLLE